MKIDKINDEFIVNCTNNSKEERQEVYKFLVDNRNYGIQYLSKSYPIIVCNKQSEASNWDTLIQYYNWSNAKKDIPVYTFEQFKEMYLDNNNMKTYTIQELRNAPIQIKVCSEEQAIQLAYAVGHKAAWKPFNPEYPIYCYLNEWDYPLWNCSENEKKSDKPTIIEFNQIKDFIENKKLIGYKLVKPEYEEAAKKICNKDVKWTENDKFNLSTSENVSIPRLKEAGVLNLWFEPVYEEEQFKVGDWVLTSNTASGWGSSPSQINNKILKITFINKLVRLEEGGRYYFEDLKTVGKEILRKATPEEIEEANKKIVKMYSSNKGEFEIEVINGKAYYKPENKHLPKEWIRDIINSFGEIIMLNNTKKEKPYNVTISSLNVGCYHNCKKEDWENVYKLLK